MNRAGKYASTENSDPLELLKIIYELTEKERMIMWSEGYIDIVIEKLPDFARDILIKKKAIWEDTKEFVSMKVKEISHGDEFKEYAKKSWKEFAIYIMEHYPEYQSLLFGIYDKKIKDSDIRKYVYRNRFSSHKNYLR